MLSSKDDIGAPGAPTPVGGGEEDITSKLLLNPCICATRRGTSRTGEASSPISRVVVTPAALRVAIERLLRTFCVQKEHTEGEVVLGMHPLTREFFLCVSTDPVAVGAP